MGLYAAGWSHAGVNTADKPMANLLGGTGQRLKIREIKVGISVASTTAPLFYLVRTTARGTQTTTLAGIALDPADVAAVGTVDSVWSADPTKAGTIATASIDVGGLAVTAGGMIIWTFSEDSPLIIPATSGAGLAVYNSAASGTTTGTLFGSFLWEE